MLLMLYCVGDFNCQPGSRFYSLYTQLISDLHLVESDVKRLPSVTFTYCNDSGTATSWIDHFLCCNRIDNLIEKVDIRHSFVTSDHKPLQLRFRNRGAPDTATQTPVNLNGNAFTCVCVCVCVCVSVLCALCHSFKVRCERF